MGCHHCEWGEYCFVTKGMLLYYGGYIHSSVGKQIIFKLFCPIVHVINSIALWNIALKLLVENLLLYYYYVIIIYYYILNIIILYIIIIYHYVIIIMLYSCHMHPR